MKRTEEIALPSLQLSFQLIKELKTGSLKKKMNFSLRFSRFVDFFNHYQGRNMSFEFAI